jgi:hypothetical protein
VIRWLLSLVTVCLVIAFVCSAIRKHEPKEIVRSGVSLFAYLTGGTLAFCAILFLVMEIL